VLEVGAGDGALTQELARHCRTVVAYEIDPHLVDKLRRRLRQEPTVRCVAGDFLAARPPREPFTVVGNIPYAITSRIIDWCLRAPHLQAATLVTQWEYARKRTGDYGRWSRVTILSWPIFSWRLVGRISRYHFRPIPAVDSGILHLERRETPLVADLVEYQAMVKLGFSGMGGSLYASLRRRYPGRRLAAGFWKAGVDPATPVGLVTPQQWVILAEEMTS